MKIKKLTKSTIETESNTVFIAFLTVLLTLYKCRIFTLSLTKNYVLKVGNRLEVKN